MIRAYYLWHIEALTLEVLNFLFVTIEVTHNILIEFIPVLGEL
jgi:hypothetical protein